jgi:Tol biopolymer transport system component
VRKVLRDGTHDTALVLQTFSPRFSFFPNGKSFIYSQNAINERFNDYNDLYRYDMSSDKTTRYKAVNDHGEKIKNSLRARDPDISSDGKKMVFVQNALHQNWLSVADIDGDTLHVRTLVPAFADTQHASPRFSPDGKHIVVSTWFMGGKRDIALFSSETGAFERRITYDTALDGNPNWSPDGRYIVYESDSDGISNIYAYDTREEQYYRITRVVGGAFQPDVSLDGKWLLFRNASGIGFDIHEVAFDPTAWEKVEYTPDNGYQKSAAHLVGNWITNNDGVGTDIPRPKETPESLHIGEKDKPYTPWSTLLPFQYNWVLVPLLYNVSGDYTLDLVTFGSDVLLKHSYTLSLGTSLRTQHLNWAVSYSYDAWYPTFTIAGSEVATAFRDQLTRAGHFLVSLPIKIRHFLGLNYVFQQRSDLGKNSYTDLGNGNFGWLELGYSYNFTRRYAYSVGAEDGRSVALTSRIYHQGLGSPFSEALITADGRLFINNPWLDNHVLALRLVAVLPFGPDFREGFFLGGAQAPSAFTVQTDRTYPLRGFEADATKYRQGTGVLAAYAEYRFPLWQVNRGLWTLPIYVQRLHMALFAEGGETFGNPSDKSIRQQFASAWAALKAPRLGAGAELRTDFTLGWAIPLTLRLGVGLPVLDGGRSTGATPLYYFNFGTAI